MVLSEPVRDVLAALLDYIEHLQHNTNAWNPPDLARYQAAVRAAQALTAPSES
jgi:hypothetical protein